MITTQVTPVIPVVFRAEYSPDTQSSGTEPKYAISAVIPGLFLPWMSHGEDQYLVLVLKNEYKSNFKTNSFNPKYFVKKAFLYITTTTIICIVWELQLMK
jgi:hypothetical protein